MQYINGDLLALAESGSFDVIVHGCNCFCNMRAGIAASIKKRYPECYYSDLNSIAGNINKLGSYTSSQIKTRNCNFIIINGYTQYHWKGDGALVDYDAIEKLFRKIRIDFKGKKIAYPLIGAGLARGNWEKISKIIDIELNDENHVCVIK